MENSAANHVKTRQRWLCYPRWGLRTMFVVVTLAAGLLALGTYCHRYFRDHYAEELRIECDVPGTLVYADGVLLGEAPLRIFSGKLVEGYDFYHHGPGWGYPVGGRGLIFSTPRNAQIRLEFASPKYRPGGIVTYATPAGERAFVRPAKIGLECKPLKMVLRVNLLAHKSEFWIDCDVKEAVIFVNGRQIGHVPILETDHPTDDVAPILSSGGEGVGVPNPPFPENSRVECWVPGPLSKRYDCYQRDGQTFLRIDKAELKSEPGEKVTLHLYAKRKSAE